MSKDNKDKAVEETAMTVAPSSDILALSPDGNMQEVISENFGNNSLTLADLDKIKIPAAGGRSWTIPTILEDEEDTTKELVGVIIGWADKKSWWQKSYGESGGKEQPDCKSNDMVHGIGDPTAFINPKEQALMDAGKAGMPVRGSGGWLCSTCPHNLFGSAPQGGGKACQDKRFMVVLLKDSVIPILLRVPATSIAPAKVYFKRLAGGRKSCLSVLTSMSLITIKGTQEYSQIVFKAARYLTDDETAAVRKLRAPFQAALDAEDSIEAGYVEKNAAEETLNDMPGHTGDAATPAAGGSTGKQPSDPF